MNNENKPYYQTIYIFGDEENLEKLKNFISNINDDHYIQLKERNENNIITNIPSDKIEGLAKVFNISPAGIMGWDKDDEQYYQDKEAAEYAEMLRTRPEMRLLFSASRGISKEEMQEAVNYIEFIKSRNKK